MSQSISGWKEVFTDRENLLQQLYMEMEIDAPVNGFSPVFVPGAGNFDGGIVCVGASVTASDEAVGIPFSGVEGELLVRFLGAVDLSREDVFCTKVVKRKPVNGRGQRSTRKSDVLAYAPYFQKELEFLKPSVMFMFGALTPLALWDDFPIDADRSNCVMGYYGDTMMFTFPSLTRMYRRGRRSLLKEARELVLRHLKQKSKTKKEQAKEGEKCLS